MINLLPLQAKEELQKEEQLKIAVILALVVFYALLSLFLIFFSLKIYIVSELGVEKKIVDAQEEKFHTPEIETFQKTIAAANKDIAGLDHFYQGRVVVSDMLEKISTILPPGVYLTNFSWQQDTGQIGIYGFASTRDDLFALKNSLEKEQAFKQVNFPASNWVKQKDIDFSVTFVLAGLSQEVKKQ